MLASVATTAHWPVYCLGINLGPAHCLQGAICKHLSIKLLQLPEPFSSGQAIPEWQMLAGATTVCALVKRTPPTINAMRKCETLSTGFGPRFRWIADPITVKNSWHHSCGAFKFEKVTWPLKSNIHCHKQFHPVSFCSLGSGSELHWSCPQTPWSLAPSISSALQWQNSTLLVGMYDDIGQLGHSHWKWRATIGATSASNFNQACLLSDFLSSSSSGRFSSSSSVIDGVELSPEHGWQWLLVAMHLFWHMAILKISHFSFFSFCSCPSSCHGACCSSFWGLSLPSSS